jgi:outer membrane protein OmpA-like peptidoglycan-associated protein
MRSFIYCCLSTLSLFIVIQANAQSDAENCKDHPLFSRMKGFYIAECKSGYEEESFVQAGYKLIGGKTDLKKVEGNKTRLVYRLEEGAQKPTALQIRRNFGNAIKSIGGTVVMETSEWDFGNADLITLKHSRNGTTIWASVYIHHFADGQEFVLTVVEPEAMQQDVAATDLLKQLNEKGFLSFQINFPTNSAVLSADSKEVVDHIVSLLQADPSLKLRIEGHTDNQGTEAANLTLSANRARAVQKAVEARLPGSAARLQSKGLGQTKPVADNSTEEGRARNRRVDIVKL